MGIVGCRPSWRRNAGRRICSSCFGLWALGMLAGGSDAHAAPLRLDTPSGWTEGDRANPAARARARAWARPPSHALRQVLSPATEDDFAETLAVIEIDRPLSEPALRERTEAEPPMRQALAPLAPSSLQALRIDALDGETARLRARWTRKGITHYVALVPSGPTQTMVVMAIKDGEESLYRPVFDAAIDSLEGVAPPVKPFRHDLWLLGTGLGWVVLAGGLLAGWGMATRWDLRRTTVPTALVLVALAVASGIVTYWVLGRHGDSLRLGGVGRDWIAIETALMGVVTAALIWFGPHAMTRSRKQIRSAPSEGAFASQSRPRVPKLYDPTGVELVKVPESSSDGPASDSSASKSALGPTPSHGHDRPALATDPDPANLASPEVEESRKHDPIEDMATRPHRSLAASQPPPRGAGRRGRRPPAPRSTPVAAPTPPASKPEPSGMEPEPGTPDQVERGRGSKVPRPKPKAGPGKHVLGRTGAGLRKKAAPARPVEDRTPIPGDPVEHGEYGLDRGRSKP